jgi:mono/diheme cytochrome c family protein
MKILKIGLIVVALALFIFACTQAPTNTNSTRITQNVNGTTVSYDSAPTNATNTNAAANDELASFKKIYTEKCVLCHKETGEGGQVDIEGDKFKVPNFKNDKAIKADDKDFTDIITKGEEKMPAFGKNLKPEEIAGLVKYIRKEFQGK